jgi:hypothetical protein
MLGTSLSPSLTLERSVRPKTGPNNLSSNFHPTLLLPLSNSNCQMHMLSESHLDLLSPTFFHTPSL